jgi:hypothetical protein
MASKIYQEQIEVLLKISQLLVPYRRTSTCAVDKDDPLAALRMKKLLKV